MEDVSVVGIDLAKTVFQVHGIDARNLDEVPTSAMQIDDVPENAMPPREPGEPVAPVNQVPRTNPPVH